MIGSEKPLINNAASVFKTFKTSRLSSLANFSNSHVCILTCAKIYSTFAYQKVLRFKKTGKSTTMYKPDFAEFEMGGPFRSSMKRFPKAIPELLFLCKFYVSSLITRTPRLIWQFFLSMFPPGKEYLFLDV